MSQTAKSSEAAHVGIEEHARPAGDVDPEDSAPDAAAVVLHAETLRTGARQVTAERVRISKRVVTETRTVTVQVRREELHVDRVPMTEDADAGADAGGASLVPADGTEPMLVLVLHEEIPEVVLTVVPVERVHVFLDTVAGTEVVSADVRREQADVVTEPTRR